MWRRLDQVGPNKLFLDILLQIKQHVLADEGTFRKQCSNNGTPAVHFLPESGLFVTLNSPQHACLVINPWVVFYFRRKSQTNTVGRQRQANLSGHRAHRVGLTQHTSQHGTNHRRRTSLQTSALQTRRVPPGSGCAAQGSRCARSMRFPWNACG